MVRYEVEVLCTADNIPPELILQLAGLEIGDSIHASSVTLPDGVEFVISDRDFTIATIAAPTIMVEETTEDEEGEESAEAAEGEDGVERQATPKGRTMAETTTRISRLLRPAPAGRRPC